MIVLGILNYLRMKTELRMLGYARWFWITALILMPPEKMLHAQTHTLVKSFGALTNISGVEPSTPLAAGPDGTLYGACLHADGRLEGTVFKINNAGFVVLKHFGTSIPDARGNPVGGLVVDNTVLYGITTSGSVFRMNTDGTEFSWLWHFGEGPIDPRGRMLLSAGTLYGTARFGGTLDKGIIFKVSTNGSAPEVLHEFDGPNGDAPVGDLVLIGDELLGTTEYGGDSDSGTVFKVRTDGTEFIVVKHFDSLDPHFPGSGLIESNGSLYGTLSDAVFRIEPNGSGFQVLNQFNGTDGYYPSGPLTIIGDVIYGTTDYGALGDGTAYKLHTDGSEFLVIKEFDDSEQHHGLIFTGGMLKGASSFGGDFGRGSVYEMSTNGTAFSDIFSFKFSGEPSDMISGVMVAGTSIYGTSRLGGSANYGTAFKLDADGSSFAVLHNFDLDAGDGVRPEAALTLLGNDLFGTVSSGQIFKMKTNGSGYTVIHEFQGTNGSEPREALTVANNMLYGSTYSGGAYNAGVIFKVNTNGSGFSVLKEFEIADGEHPLQPTVSGGMLYGATERGGSMDGGVIFRMNTNGTGFVLLKEFAVPTNYAPSAPILYGSALFGIVGGQSPSIFRVNTNGSAYTVLKEIPIEYGIRQQLTLAGGKLYGAAGNDSGIIFSMNTNGTDFRILHDFRVVGRDTPVGRIVVSGSTVFGTTTGFVNIIDTVYKIDLSSLTPIPLIFARLNNSLILTWNNPDFVLQASGNAGGAFTNIPGAASPYTNTSSGSARFFRLKGMQQ